MIQVLPASVLFMGGTRRKSFDDVKAGVEDAVGRIPLQGRYHSLPRKFEDDYELSSRVLGDGCNGEVKLATRKGEEKGEKFAVKVLNFANTTQEELALFKSELEIFLRMDHPHIVRLYDVYESKSQLHLVMECMEGGELFERVRDHKKFSEAETAELMRQMLLAVNYMHSHGIVHRDLKLENFLFDKKDSSHLKLIDFGFSSLWSQGGKMHLACGTLSYAAPELLNRSYTSQCDLWSLGVIGFILMSGRMPFSGLDSTKGYCICAGKYSFKPEHWAGVSENAKDFIRALMEVDPNKRLTAQTALEHTWIAQRHSIVCGESMTGVDSGVADALYRFGHASKFRRCCMEMVAWSLSNDERAKVRDCFLSMDKNNHGTITLGELKEALSEKLNLPDAEVRTIFAALDSNHDQEIHYSDFLAAMVSTQIDLSDVLMCSAFKKLDTDCSGYITAGNLREIFGDRFEGESVEAMIAEADQLRDRRISYDEFVTYLYGRGAPEEPLMHGHTWPMTREAQSERADTKRGSFFITDALTSLAAKLGRKAHAMRMSL